MHVRLFPFFYGFGGRFKEVVQDVIDNTGYIGGVFFSQAFAKFAQRHLAAVQTEARIEDGLLCSVQCLSERVALAWGEESPHLAGQYFSGA